MLQNARTLKLKCLFFSHFMIWNWRPLISKSWHFAASEDIMTKSKSQGLHIIRIKYWNASRSGSPPPLIPALCNIGILLHKQATVGKHFWPECTYLCDLKNFSISRSASWSERTRRTGTVLSKCKSPWSWTPSWTRAWSHWRHFWPGCPGWNPCFWWQRPWGCWWPRKWPWVNWRYIN